MRRFLRHIPTLLIPIGLLAGACDTARAADPALAAPTPAPAPAPSGWSYRVTPYGWLIALEGTQTVRGRSVKIDASFADIVDKSDTLLALMGNFEARNGPLGLYADMVWTKMGADGSAVRSRSGPDGAAIASANAQLDFQMAIVEIGAAYEVARSGDLAVDLTAGLRYWYQEADLTLDIAGLADIDGLLVAGGRGFARSGSVDWLDPVIGARLRYAVAPGHELFLRGDIGGFSVGSRFSWQAIAGYGFDFGTYNGIVFSGILGYRALSVDYSQGEGRHRYEFDMIQHGPVIGLSMKF